MTAGREAEKDLKALVSLLSFVPPVGSGCPPQMIELIHNYEHFASSIYLLCPGEQSITPPLVFSKHHECLMAVNLLPTSNHRANPYTCNTALIFCCFNTATLSLHPEENSCVVLQLSFFIKGNVSFFQPNIYSHHLPLGMSIFCGV